MEMRCRHGPTAVVASTQFVCRATGRLQGEGILFCARETIARAAIESQGFVARLLPCLKQWSGRCVAPPDLNTSRCGWSSICPCLNYRVCKLAAEVTSPDGPSTPGRASQESDQ